MSDFDRRPRVFFRGNAKNDRLYCCGVDGKVVEDNIEPEWIDYRVGMLHFQEIDAWVDGVCLEAPKREPVKLRKVSLSELFAPGSSPGPVYCAIVVPKTDVDTHQPPKPTLADLW